jgi:ribose 5-phosphate isomerase B
MTTRPTIIVGADHAGFDLKEYVKKLLEVKGYRVEDVGTSDRRSVDYPDFAEKVGTRVAEKGNVKGILACGTGIGASIAANKIAGVRAALVHDPRSARLSRMHNNANVLVLPGRPYKKKDVARIVNAWLTSRFAGGRHRRRVNKINRLEKKFRR